jgi:hypothetical protein
MEVNYTEGALEALESHIASLFYDVSKKSKHFWNMDWMNAGNELMTLFESRLNSVGFDLQHIEWLKRQTDYPVKENQQHIKQSTISQNGLYWHLFYIYKENVNTVFHISYSTSAITITDGIE